MLICWGINDAESLGTLAALPQSVCNSIIPGPGGRHSIRYKTPQHLNCL